jgi:acyl-coenzyme A synthetase/AMP-(fatty) acid ligase
MIEQAQVGNALIASGIEKGDRVAICMQNNPEYLYTFMGIVGIGAVCVPLNSWWVPSEVLYGLEHSDAKLLFADQKRLQGLESMPDVIKIVTSYTPDSNFKSINEFLDGHSKIGPMLILVEMITPLFTIHLGQLVSQRVYSHLKKVFFLQCLAGHVTQL